MVKLTLYFPNLIASELHSFTDVNQLWLFAEAAMCILRRYLKYPIVMMVTFFADGKGCQKTDKIMWFVLLLLAITSSDVRKEKCTRSAGAFGVLAEQL